MRRAALLSFRALDGNTTSATFLSLPDPSAVRTESWTDIRPRLIKTELNACANYYSRGMWLSHVNASRRKSEGRITRTGSVLRCFAFRNYSRCLEFPPSHAFLRETGEHYCRLRVCVCVCVGMDVCVPIVRDYGPAFWPDKGDSW